MPWSTLFNRRVVFDAIEMTDWRMYVETFPDGTPQLPALHAARTRAARARGRRRCSTCGRRAGEFTYADHGTPWSVVTRNLDVTVARPNTEYRGQASFSNGTVAIQNYVPMRADMRTTFRIVGGKVVLDRIDLTTDGAESLLTGEVDLARWPEQLYHVHVEGRTCRGCARSFSPTTSSRCRARATSPAPSTCSARRSNGRSRTGRELKGNFYSALAGVNDYRFSDLRGSVLWVPESLEVTNATAGLYGGAARFGYRMAPLGQRGVPATATVRRARTTDVDLTAFTEFPRTAGHPARRAGERAQPARMAAGTLRGASRRGRDPHRRRASRR